MVISLYLSLSLHIIDINEIGKRLHVLRWSVRVGGETEERKKTLKLTTRQLGMFHFTSFPFATVCSDKCDRNQGANFIFALILRACSTVFLYV